MYNEDKGEAEERDYFYYIENCESAFDDEPHPNERCKREEV